MDGDDFKNCIFVALVALVARVIVVWPPAAAPGLCGAGGRCWAAPSTGQLLATGLQTQGELGGS